MIHSSVHKCVVHCKHGISVIVKIMKNDLVLVVGLCVQASDVSLSSSRQLRGIHPRRVVV